MTEDRDEAKHLIQQRKMAYTQSFIGPHGEAVLADLAKFCRARETTFNTDPRLHALLEGRREVWLRIAQHLNISEDELFNHYR